jgi:hypothetical protein
MGPSSSADTTKRIFGGRKANCRRIGQFALLGIACFLVSSLFSTLAYAPDISTSSRPKNQSNKIPSKNQRNEMNETDAATKDELDSTDIATNETASKGISLAQLDSVSTMDTAEAIETVDHLPKVKSVLPEDTVNQENPLPGPMDSLAQMDSLSRQFLFLFLNPALGCWYLNGVRVCLDGRRPFRSL